MIKSLLKPLAISATLLLCGQLAQAATITNISESAQQVSPILPGLIIPDAALKNTNGEPVSMTQLINKKPTVLVVYRGGWCPYCSKQLANIQKVEQQLTEKGFQIIAVSPDSPEKLSESKIS